MIQLSPSDDDLGTRLRARSNSAPADDDANYNCGNHNSTNTAADYDHVGLGKSSWSAIAGLIAGRHTAGLRLLNILTPVGGELLRTQRVKDAGHVVVTVNFNGYG